MTHLQSAFGALSESNQQQQQQQQQQQMSQQNQNFCQPMQTKPTGFFNQQTNLFSNQQQQQPMQQPYNNAYQATNQVPCQNSFGPTMQAPSYPSSTGCYLPPNLLDQLRSLTNNSTPIFILPAGSLTSSSSNSNTPCVTPCYPPTCIPYPMPLPIYHNFATKNSSSSGESVNCKCTSNNASRSKSQSNDSSEDNWQMEIGGINWNTDHVCQENKIEGTVCSKKNCPSSIQLQAMISQLLAIQGVIPSAVTRILLKRVPGSNIQDSVDEIMEKAMRCIRQLPKDGLLRESCNSREVTKLLGLYLTSSSTIPRIIPVLTTVQLKCNILKALVENLVTSRLMEEKNCGVEGEEPLDRLLLELKPEDELRQMLATLREKECDERVNMSFAACATQRRIAEARLASVQKKIQQVENEMQRRRDLPVDQCSNLREQLQMLRSGHTTASKSNEKHYDSPDPFAGICVTTPKRLLLKPHVGSPETTYVKPNEITCESITYEKDDNGDDDCVGPRDDNIVGDAEAKSNVNNTQE